MRESRERHESDLISAILKMPLIERVIRLTSQAPSHQCSPRFGFFPKSSRITQPNLCTPLDENRMECKQENHCNCLTPHRT